MHYYQMLLEEMQKQMQKQNKIEIDILVERMQKQNKIEIAILEERMRNHIDDDGNNILESFPYWVKLQTPIIQYGGYVGWLKTNFDKKAYLRPWPHLVYFKNAEDAMAFKLRWI